MYIKMDVIKLLDELDINTKTGDNFDNLGVVLQKISEKWNENKQKNYLGDVKWVLYQYICDMDSDKIINIRCGNFALNKLISMSGLTGTSKCFPANINGENITVFHVPELDKKQLIISTHNFTQEVKSNVSYSSEIVKLDTTVYPGDVVLYFA